MSAMRRSLLGHPNYPYSEDLMTNITRSGDSMEGKKRNIQAVRSRRKVSYPENCCQLKGKFCAEGSYKDTGLCLTVSI